MRAGALSATLVCRTTSRYQPLRSLGETLGAGHIPAPDHALETLRRGLKIAQDSGNRFTESHLALILARQEAQHGHTASASSAAHRRRS